MESHSHLGRLLGDLEREVMGIFWAHGGRAVIRDVVEKLQKQRDIAYTTVMTVMNRLVEKGVLIRDEREQPHRYEVRHSEAEFYRSMAGQMLNRIHREFGPVAIACFVEEAEKVSRKKVKGLLKKLKRTV